MTSPTAYNLKETIDRGVIVVATKDYKAGELVMQETDPILQFVDLDSYTKKYKGDSACIAAYNVFCSLPEDKKLQLLSLYGPTSGVSAEHYRKLASSGKYKYRGSALTPEETETFVKVCSVVGLNMFGGKTGYFIFNYITRLAHSCNANCRYDLFDSGCSVRANRSIKAGEELTITYVSKRDEMPTHERRHKYLERKEFTCHCPRCDALGDDTRQFDCFDPDCDGVMTVCQPINNKPTPPNMCTYTGVEYVEPHLLPCTVCHRAAPADYQSKMFTLEAQLPALAERIASDQINLINVKIPDRYDPLLQEIVSLKLPRRHLMCQPILFAELMIRRDRFLAAICACDSSSIEECGTELRRVAGEYIEAIERVFPYPHPGVYSVLRAVVAHCIVQWRRELQRVKRVPSIFPPLEAKVLLQKTLRMHLVLDSREARVAELDEALLCTLQELAHIEPPMAVVSCPASAAVTSMEVCAFCEESPQRAALTLSRCGRCKQVTYCSVGCQKAHWKLHTKNCKFKSPGAIVK